MKTKILTLLIAVALPCLNSAAQLITTDLSSRHYPPKLSWINSSEENGATQTAYRICWYKAGKLVWDSGKVASDQSIMIPYEGPQMESGTLYTWKVRTWDGNGKASKWSESASYMTNMIGKNEWKAKWIEPQEQTEVSPILHKEFNLTKPIASATVYITAHGLYEAQINGEKVGDGLLTPGWTTYDKRLQYQTYDVTEHLKKGNNAISVKLGKGWYNGRLAFKDYKKPFYKYHGMAALVQMEVRFKDGSTQTVCSDESWTSSESEIRFSSIYDGETIDAGFEDKSRTPVVVKDYSFSELVPTEGVPVRIQEILPAKRLIITPKGEKVIDFGQNISGFEILTYNGKKGQEIVISHAEELDENGNFYTTNMRSAKVTGRYICSGGQDTFKTTFTWYGFRYIKVEGMDEIDLNNFSAAVISSDNAIAGEFKCNDPQINKLQSNIVWSQIDNFIDIPTDCPQRDERLGWTGDAQIFFRTASFNRDVQDFFYKWLLDLVCDSETHGWRVPDICPDLKEVVGYGRVGWADAITIIPWQHYMAYGDKTVLEKAWPAMKGWVDVMQSECSEEGLWDKGWHYGDWLFYSVDNDCSGASAVTYKPLIQQCFYAYSAQLTAQAAEVLGMTEEAEHYKKLTEKIKEDFCRAYLTPAGFLVSSTQTAYALAVEFKMVPQETLPVLAARLAADVEKHGHLTTGFLGTPYLCKVLSDYGYADLAYKLLHHEGLPGWLYQVNMGATTIWERWDSMKPDRTIPDNGMNSFNHYSHGAIGEWLYRETVGIKETSPAFRTFEVTPLPGGKLTEASASQNTPYGTIRAAWKLEGGEFKLDLEVPVGTTASVKLPSGSEHTVTSGHYSYSEKFNK